MESGYITSAAKADQLPSWIYSEICFVGRSNSGKSTLLNALTDHRGLARTSSTPGRTQMVNLFFLRQGDKQVVLADLPGYGYSASGAQSRQHWQALVDAYLERPQIKQSFFLMDIRRAADDTDLEIINQLYRQPGSQLTVVLTKADKINQKDSAQAVKNLKAQFQALWGFTPDDLHLVPVSAAKKQGIQKLKDLVKPHLARGGDMLQAR